jgi:2-polyprenyl-6-methoxyphenol hydroxylase-like FAD-dependent oxidoreductase
MAPYQLSIVIIGSGLAGLDCAVCLGRKGHKVTVLERTSKLQIIGGGISVAPNAMRIIDKLGLMDRFLKAAEISEPTSRILKNYKGEKLATTVMRKEWQYP